MCRRLSIPVWTVLPPLVSKLDQSCRKRQCLTVAAAVFTVSEAFTYPHSACYKPGLSELADEIGRHGGRFAEMNSGCMDRQTPGQPNKQVATGFERKKGRDNVYVTVRDNNVDQALRVLKKKLQREGVFREMKNRRAYEKPSERRARESAESTRRVRKLMRKRMEREGY